MGNKKKELIREYKQNHPPMGVFQIYNLANQKVLIGSGLNLPGILNRHRFQLTAGNHPNRNLQGEWNQFGADKFAFEILDELQPNPDTNYDYGSDLAFLEELWLEKLEPYGERGYNERKKTRDEKLRLIAASRVTTD
ncbi:MAG: GIY-YIG nuclease family protein [Blastocatellia bacterium]|nr:GIY-YIG nuclease family protein [Blastocatellia bacterium]